jgi:hypothetical protein
MGTVLLVLKLVFFLLILLELVCFLSCRYIVFERHLAAKTGTNSAVSELMGRHHMDERYLEVVFYLWVFFFYDCYFHQREMISFIKLETCRLICCWLRWLLLRVLAFFNLSWEIW